MEKEYTIFGQKVRASILTLSAICVLSVCLIFFVIVPQISAISDLREKIDTKNAQVAFLKESLSNLNSVPENVLNTDYVVVNEALPSNKNIIAVFSRINQIALDSDTQLSGFTLKVGDLYARAKQKNAAVVPQNGMPVFDISVSLAAEDKASVAQFVDLVYKTLPVARVNKITSDETAASLDISFYYKPFDLDKIQQTNDVKQYQQTGGSTLQEINEWGSK